MQGSTVVTPVLDFQNVSSLDRQAGTHPVTVDTLDLAPTEPTEQGLPPAVVDPTEPPPAKPDPKVPPKVPAPPPVIKHDPVQVPKPIGHR